VSGRVLFYVQHLLGIGHLKRAATLARALCGAGLDVTFVSGGHEVPGLDVGPARFVQLPPVRAVDVYFKILVDADDQVIDDIFRARRRDLLLKTFRSAKPDVIITELFRSGGATSFGCCRCSTRHCDATPAHRLFRARHPGRAGQAGARQEMLERIERHYDLIMVHGDPKLIPPRRHFSLAHRSPSCATPVCGGARNPAAALVERVGVVIRLAAAR
jgi:predicted glycosyltransferase